MHCSIVQFLLASCLALGLHPPIKTLELKSTRKTADPFCIMRMGWETVPEKCQLCFVNVVCKGAPRISWLV